jgi:FAD dependent oxidoreductase
MCSFDGVRQYAHKLFFLLTWEMAIKQFISRHQRFHRHDWASSIPASRWIPRAGFKDYSREVITKPDHCDVNLDRDTHFRIIGYDRPMRATAIISDLVGSLLGAGGHVRTSTEVEHIEKRGGAVVNVHTSGDALAARTVILAAGKWLGRFLRCATDVKIVASPLIVASPAVSDRNFVRMTPLVDKSVNHLHHSVDGHCYSLIGGGYFADPNDPAALMRARERLLIMARNVFPRLQEAEIVETYLGYKTEIVAKSAERNYQYLIREVDEGIHAVVPGKFSLAFSLAVNAFKRLTGEEPAKEIKLPERGPAHSHVGLTRHAALIRKALLKKQGTRASAVEACQ